MSSSAGTVGLWRYHNSSDSVIQPNSLAQLSAPLSGCVMKYKMVNFQLCAPNLEQTGGACLGCILRVFEAFGTGKPCQPINYIPSLEMQTLNEAASKLGHSQSCVLFTRFFHLVIFVAQIAKLLYILHDLFTGHSRLVISTPHWFCYLMKA